MGTTFILVELVSPTVTYESCFHALFTSLFATLYEKQPPFRFWGSSHIGTIPDLIRNSIQFITNLGGKTSNIAIASSAVSNSKIFL